MTLDLATLMAMGMLACAVAGALTLVAWNHVRDGHALPCWAASYFATALAIGSLLAGQLDPNSVWTAAGFTLLTLGSALTWAGARLLGHLRPLLIATAAGPLLVVAVFAGRAFLNPSLAAMTQLVTCVVYLTLAIATVAPYAKAGIRSARALIAFLGLHATMFAIGFVEATFNLLPSHGLVGFNVVFGMIHFEQLVFAMGSSIFLVALVRERSEQHHRATASIDALTGLAARGAFLDRARRALEEALCRAEPFTLMMFDLDHFKRINDTYGHAVGDEVLRSFAQLARHRLRSTDLIGRLGGEEFAVIMPGVSLRTAIVIANRIRRALAENTLTVGEGTVRATVSGGIAAADAGATLELLLSAADAALYRAKAQGRNRVELAGRRAPDEDSVVIRVA
jgi:diguanylate cyclase (GGDEF)-like protein